MSKDVLLSSEIANAIRESYGLIRLWKSLETLKLDMIYCMIVFAARAPGKTMNQHLEDGGLWWSDAPLHNGLEL